MRRGLVNLCLVLLFSVVGAAPASAAVSVTLGGTLDVTGSSAPESVTLTADGNTITVASPDGVEGDCGTGLQVACAVDANATVRAELGGGADAFDASSLGRAVSVRAGDGNDTVKTGAGADSIVLEGEGNDVDAGGGGDVIAATGTIRGGAGDDWLSGDGTLDGGAGDDVLEGIVNAELIGGPGRDAARFALAGPTRISLDGEPNDGALIYTSNVHADVEVLRGGDADDVLTGTAGAQELDGGGGDDALNGGAGADVLDGGTGDDELTGGAGADVLRGGDGDDELAGRDGEVDDVECGAGADDAVVDPGDRVRECEHVDDGADPEPTATPDPTPMATPDPTPQPEPAPSALGSAPVAVADAAPVLRVTLVARIARRAFLRRGVVAHVHCSESCTVSAVLTVNARTAKRFKLPRRLASASGAMAHAGSVRVRVKPNASVRKRLQRVKRPVQATLTTTAVDAAGQARVVKRPLRLKA